MNLSLILKKIPGLNHLYRFRNEKKRKLERKKLAMSYFVSRLKHLDRWLNESRETTNFTYDLEEINLQYLASTISIVTGKAESTISQYLYEIQNDDEFYAYVRRMTELAPESFRLESDAEAKIARRVGWYAIVRAMKPSIVVETGIDKGLGSCVLCAAIMRNTEEGYEGKYYGTDINPNAGWLLGKPYSEFGTILYGDSLESLRDLEEKIGVFVNDSDHSSEYERSEYEAITNKLAENAIILGDNAHCNTELRDFSYQQGRSFLYWGEWPKRHWYPGGGIGFSFFDTKQI